MVLRQNTIPHDLFDKECAAFNVNDHEEGTDQYALDQEQMKSGLENNCLKDNYFVRPFLNLGEANNIS